MLLAKLLWVGLIFSLVACSSTTSIPTESRRVMTITPVVETTLAAAEIISEGESLFLRWCSSCHGVGGVGKVGPSFTDWLVLPIEFVLLRVRQGPAVMYEFTTQEVPDKDVAKIVAYLQAKVVGTTLTAPSVGELAQGRTLYLEYCAECHGVRGFGKQDTGPALNRYPPFSITRIVEGGLLPLPNMPRLTIMPDELRLVAMYVQSWAK